MDLKKKNNQKKNQKENQKKNQKRKKQKTGLKNLSNVLKKNRA